MSGGGDFLYKPFVYWGQARDHVSLKVDLKDSSAEHVDLSDKHLLLKAQGIGVSGNNNYELEMDFFLPIDIQKSRYKVTPRCIEFYLAKEKIGEAWPRLTADQTKLPWLMIDFDKVYYDEDEDESSSEGEEDVMSNEKMESWMEDIQRQTKKTEKTAKTDLKLVYLCLYNLFQFVGYTYIFSILIYRYMAHGKDSLHLAMDNVGAQLMICQLVAMLEIIHSIAGLSKASPLATVMQVLGRNFLLFVIIAQEPRLHDAPVLFYLFALWSAIEVIRYPYYVLIILQWDNYVITWLRYTLWVPLYPLGLLSEGTIVIIAIPFFEITGKFSIELPNPFNISFSFVLFLKIYVLILAAGGYFLLNHMYRQRRVKLNIGQRKMSDKRL